MCQVLLPFCKHGSEVMGRAILTLLLQIKNTTPENSNNIGLTFSPENQLPQVEQKRIFSMCL